MCVCEYVVKETREIGRASVKEQEIMAKIKKVCRTENRCREIGSDLPVIPIIVSTSYSL